MLVVASEDVSVSIPDHVKIAKVHGKAGVQFTATVNGGKRSRMKWENGYYIL